MTLISKFLCWIRGHQLEFTRNIHGDRALVLGARSVWTCTRCGKRELHYNLHHETSNEE